MKRTFKRTLAMCVAVTTMIISMGNLSVNAATWSTPYGTMTGTSRNATWQMANSPTYRRVTATTTIPNATPYIYAGVEAYNQQGSTVLSNEKTNTNATSAETFDQSTAYVNSALTGEGTHSVWSSSYARQNRYTSF